MPNVLGAYNPLFYAQEALIQLEKALGMAGRVHRGYDDERRSFGKGDTIRIKRPSTFTAQDAPSTAQDVSVGTVDIALTNWKEVKFALTDKELSYTGAQIINDHIKPAAYALADDIDQKLASLYKDIPWFVALNSTIALSDVTNIYQKLFDNQVPMNDPAMLHYMINGSVQNGFQQLVAFNQAQTAGQAGLDTLMRGSLGIKFGMELFANQNVPTHTSGVSADATGTLDATTVTINLTSIVVNAVTIGGTFKQGDTLLIAGNTQRYAITADATANGSGIVTLAITPPLVQTYTATAVVTIDLTANAKAQNLAFHRNAFALGMAPLDETGNGLGARMATVTDPVTGLSIRSRMFYDGNNSKVFVALDTLYGFKTLDPNLAVRGYF